MCNLQNFFLSLLLIFSIATSTEICYEKGIVITSESHRRLLAENPTVSFYQMFLDSVDTINDFGSQATLGVNTLNVAVRDVSEGLKKTASTVLSLGQFLVYGNLIENGVLLNALSESVAAVDKYNISSMIEDYTSIVVYPHPSSLDQNYPDDTVVFSSSPSTTVGQSKSTTIIYKEMVSHNLYGTFSDIGYLPTSNFSPVPRCFYDYAAYKGSDDIGACSNSKVPTFIRLDARRRRDFLCPYLDQPCFSVDTLFLPRVVLPSGPVFPVTMERIKRLVDLSCVSTNCGWNVDYYYEIADRCAIPRETMRKYALSTVPLKFRYSALPLILQYFPQHKFPVDFFITKTSACATLGLSMAFTQSTVNPCPLPNMICYFYDLLGPVMYEPSLVYDVVHKVEVSVDKEYQINRKWIVYPSGVVEKGNMRNRIYPLQSALADIYYKTGSIPCTPVTVQDGFSQGRELISGTKSLSEGCRKGVIGPCISVERGGTIRDCVGNGIISCKDGACVVRSSSGYACNVYYSGEPDHIIDYVLPKPDKGLLSDLSGVIGKMDEVRSVLLSNNITFGRIDIPLTKEGFSSMMASYDKEVAEANLKKMNKLISESKSFLGIDWGKIKLNAPDDPQLLAMITIAEASNNQGCIYVTDTIGFARFLWCLASNYLGIALFLALSLWLTVKVALYSWSHGMCKTIKNTLKKRNAEMEMV